MARREVRETTAKMVAVMASAELDGLAEFLEVEGTQVMALTLAGQEWNRERGLAGLPQEAPMPGPTHREDVLLAFFAFYSRGIGLPLMPDEVLYEAVTRAEQQMAGVFEQELDAFKESRADH